jgi:hypothetical protein
MKVHFLPIFRFPELEAKDCKGSEDITPSLGSGRDRATIDEPIAPPLDTTAIRH